MSFTDFKKFLLPGFIVLIFLAVVVANFSSSNLETEPKVSESAAVTPIDVPIEKNTTEEVTEGALEDLPAKIVEDPPSKPELLVEEIPNNKVEEPAVVELSAVEPDVKVMPAVLPVIKFVEGSDYIIKFPDEQPKEPLLMEFFSYMCPHCFNFEPTLLRWKEQRPASVKFIKVPVTFGRTGSWELAARAYYIAQELNLEKQFSQIMFRKIHIENKPPAKESDIGALFLTLGVSNKKFKQAANSFNVDSNLRKAEFLSKKYKVTGVPYFLINKKYETGKDSYESEQALFRLWNNLPSKDFMP